MLTDLVDSLVRKLVYRVDKQYHCKHSGFEWELRDCLKKREAFHQMVFDPALVQLESRVLIKSQGYFFY